MDTFSTVARLWFEEFTSVILTKIFLKFSYQTAQCAKKYVSNGAKQRTILMHAIKFL